MQTLLIAQIILVMGLVTVILVQKTSSDGFTGASSPSAFLTGRAQANLFTRITSVLAILFLLNSLVLAYMASHTERGIGILDKLKSNQTSQGKKETEKPVKDKAPEMKKTKKASKEVSVKKESEEKTDEEETIKKDTERQESSVPISD